MLKKYDHLALFRTQYNQKESEFITWQISKQKTKCIFFGLKIKNVAWSCIKFIHVTIRRKKMNFIIFFSQHIEFTFEKIFLVILKL